MAAASDLQKAIKLSRGEAKIMLALNLRKRKRVQEIFGHLIKHMMPNGWWWYNFFLEGLHRSQDGDGDHPRCCLCPKYCQCKVIIVPLLLRTPI